MDFTDIALKGGEVKGTKQYTTVHICTSEVHTHLETLE